MTKNKRPFLLLILLSFLFTGCFETTEELTIADNGSGTYHVNMNMDQLFSMLDAMKSMDTTGSMDNADSMLSKKVDTTIRFSSITDTAKGIPASDKALLKNATMRMLMSQSDQKFQVDMNFPFTRINDVQKIMALGRSGAVGRVLGNTFGNGANALSDAGSGQLPDLNGFYDITVKKGLVQRVVNQKKLDSLMQNEQVKEMLQGGDNEMLDNIKFNTVIHLPKPVKKWNGDNVKLSDDKKVQRLWPRFPT